MKRAGPTGVMLGKRIAIELCAGVKFPVSAVREILDLNSRAVSPVVGYDREAYSCLAYLAP